MSRDTILGYGIGAPDLEARTQRSIELHRKWHSLKLDNEKLSPYEKTVGSLSEQRLAELAPKAIELYEALQRVIDISHALMLERGWWSDLETGADERWDYTEVLDGVKTEGPKTVATMLANIHGEVSEAWEAHRQRLHDDKLHHMPGLAVELADAIFRIVDTAGGIKLPLAQAYADKFMFNAARPDHSRKARAAAGGKKV